MNAKPNPNCTYCGGEGTDRSTKLGESRIVPCDFCHHEGDFDPAVGAKFDEGKLRYDLIPPEALAEWVRVLTYGAEKYSDRNWENGIDTGRLFAAMQRHAWAWHGGEELDPEMQIHHMAAVMFNAAAIITYYHRDRIDQAFGPTMEQVFDDVVRRGAGVTVTRVDPDEAFGPTASVDTYDEAAPLPPEAFTKVMDKAPMFREFAGMTYTLSGDQTKGDVCLDGVWYNKLSLKPSGGSMLDDVAVEKTYRKDDPLREERRVENKGPCSRNVDSFNELLALPIGQKWANTRDDDHEERLSICVGRRGVDQGLFARAGFKEGMQTRRRDVGNLTHEQKQMQGGDEQGASNDSAYRQAKAERPRRDPDPE